MSMLMYVKVLVDAPDRDLDELVNEMKPLFEKVRFNREYHFVIGEIDSDSCAYTLDWIKSIGATFEGADEGGVHMVSINQYNDIDEQTYGQPSETLGLHIQVDDGEWYDAEYEDAT